MVFNHSVRIITSILYLILHSVDQNFPSLDLSSHKISKLSTVKQFSIMPPPPTFLVFFLLIVLRIEHMIGTVCSASLQYSDPIAFFHSKLHLQLRYLNLHATFICL